MSYWGQGAPGARYAEGTLMSGTASSAVSAQATTPTGLGVLMILVVYASVDLSGARDDGEGWVLVESRFDGQFGYGIGMWAAVSSRVGTTRAGLTLPTAGNWASVVGLFLPGTWSTNAAYGAYTFDLAGRAGARSMYSAQADGREMSWLPWEGAGRARFASQGVELLACGCANGGTVPTATAPTGYAKIADQGIVAAPSFNVALYFRNPSGSNIAIDYTQSTVSNATFYSTTGAQTNRCGIRGWIPIVGLSNRGGRYLSRRRFMG